MSTNSYVKSLIESVYQGPLEVDGNASIIKVKVDGRDKVKADLYAHLKQNKTAYTDEKTKHSSFNSTIIKTPEGRVITIVYKETKGGGSGAGAEVTRLGESAQCWFSAVAFNYKMESLDDFNKVYSKIATKCDTDAKPDEFLKKLPEDWLESSIKIGNYMKGMDEFKGKMRTYNFHRGSSLVDKISRMFMSANRKDKQFANINKWSPADIWVMSPAGERALGAQSDDQTFGSLNKFITDNYKSGDIIGVSLKKVGATAHHEVFNYNRQAAVASIKQYKVSEKSKDAYLLFAYKDDPNMSIQFRSFSDAGSWQGEIKGKYASGGKIGGGQVAAIFKKLTGKELSSTNAAAVTKRAQKRDPKLIAEIKTNAKELGVTNLVDPTLQSIDWIYSKALSLETLVNLKKLPKPKQQLFLSDVIGYASSSTDNSAVFIKIS